MNPAISSKTTEIKANLTHFLALLPSLIEEHEGKYALLRAGKIMEFHETAVDAQIAGNQQFADELFSIQLVRKAGEELGYFSYALRSR